MLMWSLSMATNYFTLIIVLLISLIVLILGEKPYPVGVVT